MEKFKINSLFDYNENIIHRPRVSSKIREYVWEYIYNSVLKPQNIMVDNKYQYDLTLNLKKYNPEIHRYFTHSLYNDENNKFRPESKFRTLDKVTKMNSIGITSTLIDENITPIDYSKLIYDGFGFMIILLYKKIQKDKLDVLKNGMDYDYINGFEFPSSFDDQKYIADGSSVNGVVIKKLYLSLLNKIV